jgi:phage/plasmid-associated DNA primase
LDKAYTIPSDPVEKRYIKRDFILEKLSRGAAGRTEDRQFMIIIGDTACGKGVLSRLITNALEEYANTFSGENLIATKAKAGLEDERQWTWLVKKCHCRLIFANEFEMDTSETSDRFNNKTKQVIKMSAGRMKKLVSGGDPIEMRLLNTNAITSANHSTPVFLCNDTPEVAGIDRAYLERANYVMADRTSGKDITEDTDQLFVGDSSINLIERDVEIMDGMIALMCERYKKTIDKGLMPRPDFVVAETIERTGANDTGEAWFKNNFQLYRDIHKGVDMDKEFKKPDGGWDWEKLKDDDGDWFMRTDTLYNWYMDDIGSISKKAFSTMLSMSFKLKHGIKKIDRKAMNVWVGIRRIPKDKRSEFVEDEDDEDEDYHEMMMRTAGRRI